MGLFLFITGICLIGVASGISLSREADKYYAGLRSIENDAQKVNTRKELLEVADRLQTYVYAKSGGLKHFVQAARQVHSYIQGRLQSIKE